MDRIRIYILLICCLIYTDLCQATKYALVVGIGDYPVENGWKPINGDNDIPLVRDILYTNGFSNINIHELLNAEATASAIRQAFDKLINLVQEGDIIYIHFSGHGQQVTDLNGDEEDGWDEAWIPFDAQKTYFEGIYEGQNHILDDDINKYLYQLRQSIGDAGKIIVVADACHSGDGWRSEEQEALVIRGVADKFILPFEVQPYTNHEEYINWIYISACKSYQSNYEYNGVGSLTYALHQQKEKLTEITCEQLLIEIQTTIKKIIIYTQTPIIESAYNKTQYLLK